jgi:cell division protein FtsZ
MRFEFEAESEHAAKLMVVGIGGAGGNALNRMIESGLSGVEFVAINTDSQALRQSSASIRIQIGTKLTGGLGSGGKPETGRQAIEEDLDLVRESVEGADMVFITAGMGGGTGTGGAPVLARVAREAGALTVAVVTKPFLFEGRQRGIQAELGIKELKQEVDTLIVIPNQRLLQVVPRDMPLLKAFKIADEVLLHATQGISDLIIVPGLVNLDFADVRSIMQEMGDALMGTGISSGDDRARNAAEEAVSSPLLEDSFIAGARGVLVNITGGTDLTLHEVNEASTVISEAAGTDANIIFGAVVDPEMSNQVKITLIATGIGEALKRPETHRFGATHGDSVQDAVVTLGRYESNQAFGGGMHAVSDDEMEIPTFLRRQMD